jgi:hypothetical protein
MLFSIPRWYEPYEFKDGLENKTFEGVQRSRMIGDDGSDKR